MKTSLKQQKAGLWLLDKRKKRKTEVKSAKKTLGVMDMVAIVMMS